MADEQGLMKPIDPEPFERPPPRPFQFGLGTLLLLFVVLGSSLALFGSAGVVIFAIAVGFALYVNFAQSLEASGILLILLFIPLIDIVGMAFSLFIPILDAARETGNWSPILKVLAALAAWLISVGALAVTAVRSRRARTPKMPA
jgi:hypothetical protein